MGARERDATDAEPLAWLALAIFGAAGAIAAALLAEPLGELLLTPEPLDFWPEFVASGLVSPEPTELVRYAVAVAVPVAAAVAVVALRAHSLAPGWRRAGAAIGVAGSAAIVVLALVAWFERFEAEGVFATSRQEYFGDAAGIFALLAGLALAGAAASPRARTAVASALTLRRMAFAGPPLAVLLTCLLLAPALYTDSNFAAAPSFVAVHLPTTVSDVTALAAGLTPMVDHANQYANVLPYALEPPLAAFDFSPGATTAVYCLLSAVSLLALYRALALVTGLEAAALALYVPVVVVSMVPTGGEGASMVFNANTYQVLPDRLLFPCLVAWLCARHLRGLRPLAAWPIFLVAGLGAINNLESGGAAVVAAAAALAVGGGAWTRAVLGRLALQLLAGVGAAVAVVIALTLAVSGSLPDPAQMSYYSRLFGAQGFGTIAMPEVGFWWLVYATFAGALVLAAVRVARGDPERVLSAMLAFVGLLGLVAGVYYAGRSNKYTLIALFPYWGFALALLGWVVVRRIAADPRGGARAVARAGPLGLATLAGLGLALSAIGHIVPPWQQVDRLAGSAAGTSTLDVGAEAAFVATATEPDEPVLILSQNSHLIAREAGVRSVTPIADPVHVASGTQLTEVLAVLDEQGGSTVFTGTGLGLPLAESLLAGLEQRGYERVGADPASGLAEWRPAAATPG